MKYFWSVLLLLHFPQSGMMNRSEFVTISKNELHNRISGGWAGQTIGAAFGSYINSTENDVLLSDHDTIILPDGYLFKTFQNIQSLYDDVYRDLTFVQVIDSVGLEATASTFANAYAYTERVSGYAHQTVRYNILKGVGPPDSGHWLNNPHADDIDFQIEADFAGLMSPGMPQTASVICNKVGHIMNYGDGYYGGLYIATLYSLAFVSNDVKYLVEEGIKAIPLRSRFRECIDDVMRWHKQFPEDWRSTWDAVCTKWSDKTGCPDGTHNAANTDARLNAACITLALLYGQGDFMKTFEIFVRMGEKAHCSPASAGGILGVMIGYDNLPLHWKNDLEKIKSMPFEFTAMSLDDACDASYRHALQVIRDNGGKVRGEGVVIKKQRSHEVKFERSFEGHHPRERRSFQDTLVYKNFQFEFEGIGFVIKGETLSPTSPGEVIQAELYLNNKFMEKITLPTQFFSQKSDLYWKYQLPHRKHQVKLKVLDSGESKLKLKELIVYDVSIH